MAIAWNFNANDVEKGYTVIPVGDHRVRIAAVEEMKSKAGNDMLAITMDVSNSKCKLFYYLVFMPDNSTMTNTNLARIWDSFGIPVGNLDAQSWVGKVGAVKVKHEDYNGEKTAKVSFFLPKDKQNSLPAWAGAAPAQTDVPFATVATQTDAPFAGSDLPF